MPRSEAKRQKALMKKKRKQKLKKKQQRQSTSYSSVKGMIRNTRNFPFHESLVNQSWKEGGLAHILISRRQPDGNIVFGVYLVDIFCLGLKNTFCNANLSLSEYENDLKAQMVRLHNLVDCSTALAHQIIYGAIEYAEELGFKPHKDFKLSRHILEEPDKIEETGKIEFGKDGKPFFIAGPDDNTEVIIRKLEAKLGADNFHYMVELQEDDLMILEDDDLELMN